MKKLKQVFTLLLLFILLLSFAGCTPFWQTAASDYGLFGWSIWTDEDGNRFFITANGRQGKLGEDEAATITPDQKKAILIDAEEASVRLLNIGSSKSKNIALADDREIKEIDDAVLVFGDIVLFDVSLYTDAEKSQVEEEIWFYSIKQNRTILKTTDLTDLALGATDTQVTAMAYVQDDGLYTYVWGKKEPERRASIEEDTTALQYVSPNGRTVVWVEHDEEATESNIWLQYKDHTVKISKIEFFH